MFSGLYKWLIITKTQRIWIWIDSRQGHHTDCIYDPSRSAGRPTPLTAIAYNRQSYVNSPRNRTYC